MRLRLYKTKRPPRSGYSAISCRNFISGRHVVDENQIDAVRFDGLPIREIRADRDDARPASQLTFEPRLQTTEFARRRVDEDDVRRAQVGAEKIPPLHADPRADSVASRVRGADEALRGSDLDPRRLGAKLARRDDESPPVAAAEVEESLARLKVREAKRRADAVGIRRHRGESVQRGDENPQRGEGQEDPGEEVNDGHDRIVSYPAAPRSDGGTILG